MADTRFSVGDAVVVRQPEEILATLDSDGTLDGLPFMLEMLESCGKSFRVDRRVMKTCVDALPGEPPNRRFRADDVVVLEGSRCDGEGHDGCRRACRVFWKEAWLRADETQEAPSSEGRAALAARLRTHDQAGRYFCQSTQLTRATEPFDGNQRLAQLRVLGREVRAGEFTAGEALRLVGIWMGQTLTRRLGGDERLRGPHDRAPRVSLGLRPGERVRIRRRAELVATLDRTRGHRGMHVCAEMLRCCGAEGIVRERVDRLIIERSGEMRHIKDTVSLRDLQGRGMRGDEQCFCFGEFGDCPRGELMYWREAWLERVNPPVEQ